MVSDFDLSKMKSLLEDFYNLTHLHVTVYNNDFQFLVSYPERMDRPFCETLQKDKRAYEKCLSCDARAFQEAQQAHKLYVYRCHAGLTECIVPLFFQKNPAGYLMLGHLFYYSSLDEGWTQIYELCKKYHVDLATLKTICQGQPLITETFISSASHILQAIASHLCADHSYLLNQNSLALQIDEYIENHITEKIDVSSICKHFSIGKSQLYKISHQNYGCGIAEYIQKERIEKAKSLLEHSRLSLDEIAFQCGFSDYNYFITVFKRSIGISPKKYAKIHSQK